MHALLYVDQAMSGQTTARQSAPANATWNQSPPYLLQTYGYQVFTVTDEASVEQAQHLADAVILHLPIHQINEVALRLIKQKTSPLLWWCSPAVAVSSAASRQKDVVPIDGILTPSMSEQELSWALHFANKQCLERQQWRSERMLLESRLEERKWIDIAKGILCKLKGISEAEAYEVLRKQAMNERKRMVDVATSIVKVYQLLQEQK
jgi:two-component system, response regulator / RNA-binding antiterminator